MEYDKMVPFEVTTIIDMKMETKLIVETCSEYMIRNTIWRMLCGMLSGGEREGLVVNTPYIHRERASGWTYASTMASMRNPKWDMSLWRM